MTDTFIVHRLKDSGDPWTVTTGTLPFAVTGYSASDVIEILNDDLTITEVAAAGISFTDTFDYTGDIEIAHPDTPYVLQRYIIGWNGRLRASNGTMTFDPGDGSVGTLRSLTVPTMVPSANFDVFVNVDTIASVLDYGPYLRVYARRSEGDTNVDGFYIHINYNRASLVKSVSGTTTTVVPASSSTAVSNGSTVKLEVRGTNAELFVDNVSKASATVPELSSWTNLAIGIEGYCPANDTEVTKIPVISAWGMVEV